ncbi:MAG: AAA domain-containing protein [bacterium]|nr:AAA domain-containing protein [bacterium]
MQKILESYLRRLTNLSGNNRSLLLLRLISDQFIDLHDLDFANNQPSFDIIRDLIAKKSKIPIAKAVDTHDDKANKLSGRLKKIDRIEKFIFEERGAKDLFVGWPFVRGKFNEGTAVRCPLIFFPVELELSDNTWNIKLRKNVNLTLNKTFLLAYSYFNQIAPDEELLDKVFDDFDNDSTVFRTELYELLKDSSVEINFNQENFMDALHTFDNFRKQDFENLELDGQLKLHPEAVLGIFPQAGSYLVPDYVHMLEKDEFSQIEELFFSKESKENDEYNFSFVKNVKEELTFTPFELDAYQENALKAIKQGNSIIVQGPPGTGKSQLICNIISDFMARGKSILLVSQKKAALDVVYQRLSEKDLQDFVGLMHDFKNDRKTIYEQIGSQIERLNEYQQKNNTLDSIQLERKFQQASRTIDQLTEELEEFKFALFDEQECGKSIKELYLTSNPHENFIDIRQEYRQLDFHQLPETEKKLGDYLDYSKLFEKESHPWSNRKSFANHTITDFGKIKDIITEIPDYQQELGEKVKAVLDNTVDLETAGYIISKKDELGELLKILSDPKVYNGFSHMVESDMEGDSQWLSNMERTLMQGYKGFGPEMSLEASELGRFQEVLNRGIKARRSFISWFTWKFFSKDKTFLTRVLVANDLKSNKQGFNTLIEKIDNRLNIEHIFSELKDTKWLPELPGSMRKIDIQNWFYYQKLAIQSRSIFVSVRNLKDFISVKHHDYEQLSDKIKRTIRVLADLPLKRVQWEIYLNPGQIDQIAKKSQVGERMIDSLNKEFESLCEFDRIKESLSITEQKVLDKLLEENSADQKEKNLILFQNSLRLAWIDHIETKYPVLRSVSSLKFEKMERELQNAVAEKLEVSNDILLLKAREKTYHNLEYNRLNNLVTYRDLLHQVTKKRRIWPMRKLITSFEEELYDLIPCWMASPESASAIFPMKESFDVVIFDEASQCFAEKGLPAMYRGKQIVIAGDDKQLQPLDIYKVRWEDDNDEDIPELEIDSLLNLAKAHLMQVQLKGHYRSQTLELIEFSNQQFYGGKLNLLPDFHKINEKEPSIKYVKCDGIWENNVNRDEAQETVILASNLLEKEPGKSIGIVTFNAAQQGYILDLMEEFGISRKILWPENLFVKNIENVQGDERDIIIFSTAYAPDKNGRMNMKFGSLNVEGGENRLNVAITRAKEKIMIVSSILPNQLNVDGLKNSGPKLLKKYLEYAYRVSDGQYKPQAQPHEQHNADWYLKDHFRNINLINSKETALEESLPFADLTVTNNGDYRGLVMTDDSLYYESISIKDPHIYKPFLFQKKNWRFRAFFSREYWMEKELVIEKLSRFINSTEP